MRCIRRGHLGLVVCWSLWIGQLGSAQDGEWVLTTADFERQVVSLRGMDEQGVHLLGGGGQERRVGMEAFVQVERAEDLDRRQGGPGNGRALEEGVFELQLRGNERIVGRPVGMEGETLLWENPVAGRVPVEMSRLRSMVRTEDPDRRSASRTSDPAWGEPSAAQDVVRLVNDDTVSGIISDVTGEHVMVMAGADELPVPLGSVAQITFAAPPGMAAEAAGDEGAFRVQLRDGSILAAPTVRVEEGRVHLAMEGEERSFELEHLHGIEQLNGPVTWLSTKTPAESVQIPFMGEERPARMDRTVRGEPIRVGDRSGVRGIGVHSYSRLSWDLDGGHRMFRTQYAIDGGGAYANVIVRVKLDDRVVHEAKDVTAGGVSEVVRVELSGAERLTLEVDYGETYDIQDQFVWIEPALVR
jgi:hypothetical protein